MALSQEGVKFSDYVAGLTAGSESDLSSGNSAILKTASGMKKLDAGNIAKLSVVNDEIERAKEQDLFSVVKDDELENIWTQNGAYFYFNKNNKFVLLRETSGFSCTAFNVEAGKKYIIESCYGQQGQSSSASYCISGAILVSNQIIVGGNGTCIEYYAYEGESTSYAYYKNIIIAPSASGVLYVNTKKDENPAKVYKAVDVSVKEKVSSYEENVSLVPSIKQSIESEILRSINQDYLSTFVVDEEIELVRTDDSTRIVYNPTYTLSQESVDVNCNTNVFAVTAGKKYKIDRAYCGSNKTQFPLAVLFETSNISTSQNAKYTQVIDGPLDVSSRVDVYDTEFVCSKSGFIFINSRTAFVPKLYSLRNESVKERVLENSKNAWTANQWKGKKVICFGTSVDYGSNATESWLRIAAKNLGFEIPVVSVVPGLACEALKDSDTGLWYPKTYGSSSLTREEYLAAKNAGLTNITIPDNPLPSSFENWNPGSTNYNNFYRTWENVLTEETKDTDLYILEIGGNNTNFSLEDWTLFDKKNWRYTDNSSFADHRETFIGATLYLIDKIYSYNPNARICFAIISAFSYSGTKTCFETMAEQWNIPFIDVWKKINTCPPSLSKIYSLDGTDQHPSTFGQECIGKMMTNELLLIG